MWANYSVLHQILVNANKILFYKQNFVDHSIKQCANYTFDENF